MELCLLSIIRAALAEDGGVLQMDSRTWSVEGVAGVDGEGEEWSPRELFDVARCCANLEEATRSAWDCERLNWTWLGRNFVVIVEDGGTEGVLGTGRTWFASGISFVRIWLFDGLTSDSWVALFERLDV